jgi:tRNA U34 5-methylaminomethyl-2-thiouridine-forming methyltransferase MnmC
MHREIKITSDGSPTLYLPDIDEHFHSFNGAVQETMHVFINAGLNSITRNELTILEIGLGTGLNALATLFEAQKSNKTVHYFGIEKYPLLASEYKKISFAQHFGLQSDTILQQIHHMPWEKQIELEKNFHLTKIKADITQFNFNSLPKIDLVYFDAFAPDKQPELWMPEIFEQIFDICDENAILTTYSAKGEIRRRLVSTGFEVQRLQGPPGKREMLRATKRTSP